MTTYLYIFESEDKKEIYIGIGDSMSRVWKEHNNEAEELRGRNGTKILQTVEPFARREDARKAEAIAIFIASRAGQKIYQRKDTDDEEDPVKVEESGLSTTNKAGTKTTTVLQPAVYRRDGEPPVNYEDLRGTALVKITADPLDGRPAPFGGLGGAQFSERAIKWYGLETAYAENRQPRRLLAVLSGANIILGSWELSDPWCERDRESPEAGWRFCVVDPDEDNADDYKGLELKLGDYNPRNLGWSKDLSPSHTEHE